MKIRKALPVREWDIPAGVVIVADARLESMRGEYETLGDQLDDIVNAADEADRDLTDDETKKVTEISAKLEALKTQINARAARAAAKLPSSGRRTDSTIDNRGGRSGGARVEPTIKNDDPKYGFKNFGEFAQTVHLQTKGSEDATQRMRNVATTYSSESVGPDGGYAVPPDFRRDIWEKVVGEDSLMGRTTELVTSSNSITIPKDETTPWDTTTGVQVYWEQEAGQVTQSKIALEMQNFRLNKLTALVPISEELLEDGPGLDSYLRAKVPVKMAPKINTALVRGNGVGKPLGFLNAPSLITVTKEVSQDAATIVHQNIEYMWARMWAPSRQRAIWMINQDAEPQLGLMSFRGQEGSPATPIYLPGGTIAGQPYATLKGRPVVPYEAMSTVGTFGDIALVDWQQYMTVTKGQQIRTDVSIHLFFDQDLQAYRFIFRMTGQPMWGATITPENGSNTRSWAVALETRS